MFASSPPFGSADSILGSISETPFDFPPRSLQPYGSYIFSSICSHINTFLQVSSFVKVFFPVQSGSALLVLSKSRPRESYPKQKFCGGWDWNSGDDRQFSPADVDFGNSLSNLGTLSAVNISST